MPFPVVDFPEREWVMLGGPEPNELRLITARPSTTFAQPHICVEHYESHAPHLYRAEAPNEGVTSAPKRRREAKRDVFVPAVLPSFFDDHCRPGIAAMVLAAFAASDAD
jgi:hypothetical protein